MGQEDYVLKQIEILGKILGKILADLFAMTSKWEVIELETVVEVFKKELDLDLHQLVELPNEALFKLLMEDKKMDLPSIEKIGEICYLLGLDLYHRQDDYCRAYLKVAQKILEQLNLLDKTYSLDRITKIEKIKTLV